MSPITPTTNPAIPRLSWTSAGTEYRLDDGDFCYLLGHEGLGLSPLHRLEERGPLQDGVIDRGYRLDPRVILLMIGIRGESFEDFHAKRAAMINMFKPDTRPGFLRWVLTGANDTIVRQIDGYTVDGLQFLHDERTFLFQKATVAIKCPDPTWYDPTMISESFSLGGGGDVATVPSPVPSVVGASSLNSSRTIAYKGTWFTFPKIRVYGPVTNLKVVHEQTGYQLSFAGVTIASDHYYEIDLRKDTIVDQNGVNKNMHLSTDSDLTEFAILAAPKIASGLNTIRVTGSNADSKTAVEMTFNTRYIGI